MNRSRASSGLVWPTPAPSIMMNSELETLTQYQRCGQYLRDALCELPQHDSSCEKCRIPCDDDKHAEDETIKFGSRLMCLVPIPVERTQQGMYRLLSLEQHSPDPQLASYNKWLTGVQHVKEAWWSAGQARTWTEFQETPRYECQDRQEIVRVVEVAYRRWLDILRVLAQMRISRAERLTAILSDPSHEPGTAFSVGEPTGSNRQPRSRSLTIPSLPTFWSSTGMQPVTSLENPTSASGVQSSASEFLPSSRLTRARSPPLGRLGYHSLSNTQNPTSTA